MILPDSALPSESCLAANAWVCGDYLVSRREELVEALLQHLLLTVIAIMISVALAIPLALLARRSRALSGLILGGATAVYTIPSLALFALLLPFTGISATTVIIGLVLYSMTVLIRAVLDGLASVPAEAVDAARGMGFGSAGLLWRVEIPLALPTFFGGLRVAVVSTVALVTVGFVVGYGGLGNLISSGLASFFKAQVLTAAVLCVVLAVFGDLLVLGLARLSMPWRRGGDV